MTWAPPIDGPDCSWRPSQRDHGSVPGVSHLRDRWRASSLVAVTQLLHPGCAAGAPATPTADTIGGDAGFRAPGAVRARRRGGARPDRGLGPARGALDTPASAARRSQPAPRDLDPEAALRPRRPPGREPADVRRPPLPQL